MNKFPNISITASKHSLSATLIMQSKGEAYAVEMLKVL
jgi:hypothetical protein